MQTPTRPDISESFGRIGKSVHDPLQAACRRLALLREAIWNEADRKKAFLTDQNNIIHAIKPGICKAEIAEMVALFQTMPYSPALRKYTGTLAHTAALALRQSPSFQKMILQWPLLDQQDAIACLKDISPIMVRILNDQDFICINQPMIGKATLPTGSAMQVNIHNHPAHDVKLTLISVDHRTLDTHDFQQAAAMLWHEHLHIYMAALQEAFDNQDISEDHPLYKDARKESLLASYGVTGNIILSKDIYYAEPEEKICYFTQNIFYTTLKYRPPANDMVMRHG